MYAEKSFVLFTVFSSSLARAASNTAKEKREISLSTRQTPQKVYKNFRHLQMETEPLNTEKKLSLSFILFYGDWGIWLSRSEEASSRKSEFPFLLLWAD